MPPTAATLAASTSATRDRSVDALRVASLGVVMVGHTLMATVEPSGRVGNVLAVLPATQPLSWLFQVVPVFFLVGGYAHAAALTPSWRAPRYGAFVAARLGRLLPPAALLVGVWLAAGFLLERTGHAAGLAHAAARVALQPLWFLGVYVGVVAVAPPMLAAHRRFGLRVVVVLGMVTALLDVVRFASPTVPPVVYLSVATVWLAVHSLGFALRDGTLDRYGGALAAGGLLAAVLLVVVGPYPVSMVGLPGAPTSNMAPPTLVLLAQAVWLTGLVVLVRPALRVRLASRRAWTVVIAANGVAMTAFLWHLTALFGVLAIAPRFAAGSAAWWLSRPVVVAGTLLGTMLLVRVFRRVEGLRRLPVRSTPVAACGAAVTALGLLAVSATGAVHLGTGRTASLAGVPVTTVGAALLLLVGCLLVAVPTPRRRVDPGHVAERS